MFRRMLFSFLPGIFFQLNEAIPYYEGAYAQHITVHFTSAATGKRFCGPLTTFQSGPALGALTAAADGGNLQAAGVPAAGGQVGGVVKYDVASGAKGGVIRGAGVMLPVTSGAAVTAGDELEVDNTGRVIPFATGRKVGKAHSPVAGANLDVVVELYGVGHS
jgi:hypothetical protein